MGRTSSLALVAMMVMAACESAEDIDFDELAAASRDASCTYLARCGAFPDKATCLVAKIPDLSLVGTFDVNFVSAVHAGRIHFDRAAVQRCFDMLAIQTCDTTDDDEWRRYEACISGPLWRGTLHNGDACFIGAECISGVCGSGDLTSCNHGACVGDRAPAPKALPPDIGMSCPDGRCALDAWCDMTGGDRICEARANEGEPCGYDGACTFGLGCAGPSGARTCRPLPLLGEPCPDGRCRDAGQYCSQTSGTCVPIGLGGENCTSEEQCSFYYPCQLATSSPSICAPAAVVGDRCTSSEDCFEADAYCDISQGFDMATCAPRMADGEACVGYECKSGSYCKRSVAGSTTGICTLIEACR